MRNELLKVCTIKRDHTVAVCFFIWQCENAVAKSVICLQEKAFYLLLKCVSTMSPRSQGTCEIATSAEPKNRCIIKNTQLIPHSKCGRTGKQSTATSQGKGQQIYRDKVEQNVEGVILPNFCSVTSHPKILYLQCLVPPSSDSQTTTVKMPVWVLKINIH